MSDSRSEGGGLGMAIAQLRVTPRVLQLMLEAVPAADLRWKPEATRFSIAEVLAHLSHTDEYCFGLRLKRVLDEDKPPLAFYEDASFLEQGVEFVSDGVGRMKDLVETRARWIGVAERVGEEQASRIGAHATMGAITASELLHIWAFHDLGHLRQISELLRARCYYPEIGAFQSLYAVKP